jgi:hypothetical protein
LSIWPCRAARNPGGDDVPESRRDEQKLWLILFQIKGVRARLNFLAMQRWIFATLGLLIGAIGLAFFAAASFEPLTFLMLAALAVLVAMVGIIRETMLVRAMRATPARAAAIADERTQMQGRLATVLAWAEAPKPSTLWPYLVEDTYGRRENYEPSRVEPRWLSRAIFPLLASLLLVALAFPAAHLGQGLRRNRAPFGASFPGQASADIKDLDIRPADPALQPNAQIYADPATLKKLADKLAAAENEDRKRSGIAKMLDKARQFADTFQDKLNGLDRNRRNPLRMRLTDRNPGQSNGAKNNNRQPGQSSNPNGNPNGGGGLANNSGPGGHGASEPGAGQGPPMASLPAQQADELAKNGASQPGDSNQGANGANSPANPGDANSDGGASHGSGSDPASLFGPASAQPLGSDSFKIAIEAEPSDESSSRGSPTYVPPRIRVPLNSQQYPDQPLARAAVPAADQDTIKRVFER